MTNLLKTNVSIKMGKKILLSVRTESLLLIIPRMDSSINHKENTSRPLVNILRKQ